MNAGNRHVGDGAADGPFDVGVVIVTYNSADVIDGLIDTLERGLIGVRARVVAVDNASTDGTVDALKAAGLDVVAMEHNLGYSAGINRGIDRLAGTSAVLVLNADLTLEIGAVAAMLRVLEDDRVGIVAPRLLIDKQLAFSLRRDPSLMRVWGTAVLGGRVSDRFAAFSEFVTDPRQYEFERDVDWAVGAVLLIGRRCLDVVGKWDESYFLYAEEVDYCERARDAGFFVRYTPDAVVHHEGGGGSGIPQLRMMMVTNKVRHYRRRHGTITAWCFYAGALFNELTRSVAGSAASRAALRALIHPSSRPSEIGVSTTIMPV